MPEEAHPPAEGNSLPARVEHYRKEVQRLVGDGIEHPRYELTREAAIGKKNLKARLDLVKLIQGLANAHLTEERFIVIGADQGSRKFVPVKNTDEFDFAKVSEVLSKHLAPLPSFEVFNSLETDDCCPFVLIALSKSQPRPVVAKIDAQDSEGKSRIRKGDIWIKENTALRLVTRDDLDKMYKERIEVEAESRARARFSTYREEILAERQTGQFATRELPRVGLIYGKDENFRLYVEGLIADEDERRFNMLIELLRDQLVMGWHDLEAYSPGSPPNIEEFSARVIQHKRDSFLPAINRLVESGLLIIKHGMDKNSVWLQRIANLLFEVFETAHRLKRLSFFREVETQEFTSNAMPALEALIGGRAMAIYAIQRGHFQCLVPLLKKYVTPLSSYTSGGTLEPFAFWPLRITLPMPEGRTLFCWQHRIQPFWKEYFGDQDSFVEAACQFEFIVELNSYITMGLAGDEAKAWLDRYMSSVNFSYSTDLWQFDLKSIVPLAEKLYEALERGSEDLFLFHISVEKTPFQLVWKNKSAGERLDVLAGFLVYLQTDQAKFFRQVYRRFAPELVWGEKLGSLIEAFRSRGDAK